MAETGTFSTFRVTIIVMAFYAFIISLIIYAVPSGVANQVTPYQNIANDIDLEGISTKLETSLTDQTNIPVIEIGALVFYTGNYLIDLLLNFIYALPQMLGLLVHAITTLFNLDNYIYMAIQTFAMVLMTALYMLGIIQLITGVRTGRII